MRRRQTRDSTPEEESEALARTRRRLLRLLKSRPRTVQEVRDRLRRAAFPDDVIESVLEEAVARGWLDDAAFARLWVRDRLLAKPKGRGLLRRELRAKGVPEEQIERALADAFQDMEEEALIAQVIERCAPRYRGLDPKTRERRLYALLRRRGFSPGAIRRALQGAEPDRTD